MVNGPGPNTGTPDAGKLVAVSGTALTGVKPHAHTALQLAAAAKVSPNAWLLLRALRKRLLPALVIGFLVGGMVGTAVWFILPPPKQTVRALLQMEAVQPKVFFDTKAHEQFEHYQRSQIAFVKSHFVLAEALQRPQIDKAGKEMDAKIGKLKVIQDVLLDGKEAVQWLETNIKADFTLGPELMRVSMEGDEPEQLKQIVNAVTKAYLAEVVGRDRNRKLKRLEQLKEVFEKYEKKAQEKRNQFIELARLAGSGDGKVLAHKQQFAISELAATKSEWQKIQSDLRKLRVKLDIYKDEQEHGYAKQFQILYACPAAGLPVNLVLPMILAQELKNVGEEGDVSVAALDEFFKKDSLLQNYAKRLAFAESRLMALKRTAVTDHPSYPTTLQMRETEVDLAKKAIAQRRRELHENAVHEIRYKNGLQSQNTVYRLTKEWESVTRLERMLKEEVDRLQSDNKLLNENTLDIEGLKDTIKRSEDISHKVSREIDTLDVELLAPPRVQPFEDATVYVPTKNARQYLMTGMAGLGGIGVVLLAFAWFEFRSRKIDSPDEVVQELGMKLMGTLPDFSRPRSRWIAASSDAYWEHRLTNSIDAVRTTILFAAKEENLKVVLVTSAMAGEGKTASATHLAASLARAGRRTVLLDCDLRNPSAHRLLEVSRGPGFSELLRGERTLTDIIRPCNVEGLAVISAGQGDIEAIQALSQDKLGPIFEDLRQQFDFVVIDSSPILPVADALLVAQYADGVLFSILRDVSRMPKIVAALQRLSVLQIRVLGAIVNGTVDEVYGGTGYAYGYGVPAGVAASEN